MKTISFWYLACYLSFGGLGFAFLPDVTLSMFLSNTDYGDVMPRVAGMFMILLGGLIANMAAAKDFNYYRYSVLARTFAVGFLIYLQLKTGNPLFIVLLIIVLIGYLPSLYVVTREMTGGKTTG